MNRELPETWLARLSEFIAANLALHFPPERWNELRRRIAQAALESGFADQEAFAEWLVSSPLPEDKIELLASQLTIAETYFWREPQVFQALVEQILPRALHQARARGKRLRIWSAGCATGEEPYSLAMALRRVLPGHEDHPATILATDINPRVLRRARAGVYGPWSFRNPPAWIRQDHFTSAGHNRLQVRPEIRGMVDFAYLNLAQDVYPSHLSGTNAMDIIFCRNVLMYFLPERARQVVRNLHRCLVDGGWLMVGACELSQANFARFVPVQFPGAIVYRKQERPTPGRAATAPAWPQPPEGWPALFPPPPPLPPEAEYSPLPQAWPTAPASALERTLARGRDEEPPLPPGQETSGPDTAAILRLADQGRLAEAAELCDQALSLSKLDPELHYLRATIRLEMDQPDQAIASLRGALYLEPNLVVAHFALANLMLRQDNPRAARKGFDNVLGLLRDLPPEDILPEAEGLTVGRFREIVRATIQSGGLT